MESEGGEERAQTGGGGAPLPPEEDEEAPPSPFQALPPELLLAAGTGGGPCPIEENLPRILRQREWGRCRHSSFSPGERIRVSSHFLPNRVTFSTSYPQKAFCGVFSPDGSTFLSAAQDQTLRFYRCRGGGEGLWLFRSSMGREVGWSILDVAPSPDGSRCLYSSWSRYVHLYDVTSDTHTPLDLRPRGRRFAAFGLAWGGEGPLLAGGSDGFIYGFDLGAQRRVLRVEAHDDDVNAVAFLGRGEGPLLVSAGDDGIVRLWDLRALGEGRERPVGALAGHRDGVTALHARGDERHLVSNSKDQTAKLWDLRRPSGPGVVATARQVVAQQNWDYRWQEAPPQVTSAPLPGDASLMTYRGHVVLHTLVRCRLAPPPGSDGGQWLCTGCATGAVIVYDVLTGRLVRRLTNHSACVRDVSWHPGGGVLASSSWDGTVCLWGYRDPQEEDEEPPCAP